MENHHVDLQSVINGREIVIWGTRDRGTQAKEWLEAQGHLCQFFVSSRPKGDYCCGLPICTPDILDVKKHYVIVATFAREVITFLIEHGFREEGEQDFKRFTAIGDDFKYEGCFIGKGTYGYKTLMGNSYWLLGNYVKKIGRYCSINPFAKVWDNHPLSYVSTSPVIYSQNRGQSTDKLVSAVNGLAGKHPLVEIGNDVWIGANAIILEGG